MATYSTVTLEREGILAILTLNRPEKMNSLSDQLLADVRGANVAAVVGAHGMGIP